RGDPCLRIHGSPEPVAQAAEVGRRVDGAGVEFRFQPRREQHLAHPLAAAAGVAGQRRDPHLVPVRRQQLVEVEQDPPDPRLHPAAATANASLAAARVASTTAASCALDTKPASNADGARNTPRPSIAWKKRLKAAVSQATAWA